MNGAKLNVSRARDLLGEFDFKGLFNELGWSNPSSKRRENFTAGGFALFRTPIAELSGIVVYEVESESDGIPDRKTQALASRETAKTSHEHVLVFVDKARTQSVWYWVKREGGKRQPRDHYYFKGQPGDLFLSKIASLVVDLSELDDQGHLPLISAADKVKKALDVERVIKRFFEDYDEQRVEFTKLIVGIADDNDRRWYASVLLNRLMFIYFLQRRFFLDGGDGRYLENKLEESKRRGKDRYFGEFLKALFFEAFAKPKEKRKAEAAKLTGDIRYLNGGLFLPHALEQKYDIDVPDEAFDSLYSLFSHYSWNLNDIPGEEDNDINPDVLGYIFEKYINQKEFGAYYTRPEITEYLCEQTIHRLILDRINEPAVEGLPAGREFESVPEMLVRLDKVTARKLLHSVLPDLTILDPAVGSGAFLVAALKTLLTVYSAVVGWLQFHDRPWLDTWLESKSASLEAVHYTIKKAIITDNLYGVDIMEEATEIAKLRLFMTLVASAHTVEELEPLPNIDFNILSGNSLIGLMRVEHDEFDAKKQDQATLFGSAAGYKTTLDEKNRKVEQYRHASGYVEDLAFLRDEIDHIEELARPILDGLLLEDFHSYGIRFEQPTWDTSAEKQGKPRKRPLTDGDIQDLEPFHWGFEFDRILNVRGGFDAIITNPPWEIVKPYAKEFFQSHSDLVTKNKLTIREFEAEKDRLLQDTEIRAAYFSYLSRFPHQSSYYRSASEYLHQQSVANGRRVGSDVNLYKLFTERCYHLLRQGGLCGIVLPSGIYTDLGAKGLRTLLFEQCSITGLFCFENRKEIFEDVHRSFKFVVLTFAKGGTTIGFPAAFMRLDVKDLEQFPSHTGTYLPVSTILALAPDSYSIPEFKSDLEASIAAKMHRHPPLAKWIDGKPLSFSREFMTSDDHPKFNRKGDGLVIYEGKMIEQFTNKFDQPQWWINEEELRKTRFFERGDWKSYRFAIRRVASSTNSRTLISAVLPRNALVVHSLFVNVTDLLSGPDTLFLVALLNSYVLDYATRGQVTTNVTKFNIHQLPVPLPERRSTIYNEVVLKAAYLTCTDESFSDLMSEVRSATSEYLSLRPQPLEERSAAQEGVGEHNVDESQCLRNKIDALVAILYDLSEDEFSYVLDCFSSADSVKDAILVEYRKLAALRQSEASDPLAAETLSLVRGGETEAVEFKQSLELITFDETPLRAKGADDSQVKQARAEKAKAVVHSSLKTICAFLNSNGGTLLIGVHDLGNVVGIDPDLQLVKGRNVDGFELKIRAMLTSRFEPAPVGLGQVTIRFPKVDGKVVCRIDVKADAATHHLDGEVFVRDGNNTLNLKGPTLTHWVTRRAGKETKH